jgi:penicillin-binding protein 1A
MKFKVICLLVFLSLLIGGASGSYLAIARGTPSIAELKQYRKTPGTRIYADDDTLIGELKIDKGIYMSIDKMPSNLINAVVAVEDNNFWKHKGIDYLAIARAAVKDVLYRRIKEGGSTITQQLAKITFLNPEKTIKRKLREAALAVKIEKNLTKKEILDLYLNRAYFGHGAYGVEMASRTYFGKSVRDIKLNEAAMLAGLLKAPATYSPFNDFRKARQRQLFVLSRMEEEGYINKKQMEAAEKRPVYLSRLEEQESYKYFINYVKDYLDEKYGAEKVLSGNMRVYTTMDRNAQAAAQRALKAGLRELDKRRGWRGPVDHREPSTVMENNEADAKRSKEEKEKYKTPSLNVGDVLTGTVIDVKKGEAGVIARGVLGRLNIANALWASNMVDKKTHKTIPIKDFDLKKILSPGDVIKVRVNSKGGPRVDFALEQDPEVEGAVVAIDPKTGYIRVIVGGYDYRKSEYNRAVYSKRQPGSAFKPVVYALAMESGFTPYSVMTDEPVSYSGSWGSWTPSNYDGKYLGPMQLRNALAYSRNAVTVKLVDRIGVDSVIEFSKRLGIESEMPRNLSIALGSISLTPLNLAYAYAPFANGGMKVKPVAIKYITDSKGRIIESNDPESEEVLSPQTAFLTTYMLKGVVNYGTGWRAKALGRPVAGKTGTTNDYRDAWFLGYTTELLAGVWVGFDDVRPLGHGETGARAASPVWVDFMKAVSEGSEPRDFEPPEGMVEEYTREKETGFKEEEAQPALLNAVEAEKPDFD